MENIEFVPQSVPKEIRNNPLIIAFYRQQYLINHLKNGGTVKQLKKLGFKFATPV